MEDSVNNALYKELENDDLSFIYLGKFDNNILGFATEILKGHMTQALDTEGKKNKLSFLMIESFQNILRYGLLGRQENETSGEIFVVRKIFGSYYITTGNFVENDKIDNTREKLERVNSLNAEDLKKLFLQTLQNKKLSQQGGAGLGFMEMVRKTKEKLEFDFVKIDENRSFFYFQLRLKDKDTDERPSILSMAENNFGSESVKTQRTVYHILVEMLQNIAKHAKANEEGIRIGLFSMGYDEGIYTVSATNEVCHEEKNKLKNYIESLNSKGKEDLDEYYKMILRNGHADESILSGLGLIDIARDSIIKIDYVFKGKNQEEDGNIFTISAKA